MRRVSLWLASWQIAPGGPVRPGDTVQVTLTFIAARPLTADYSVKVDVIGPNLS